MVVSIALFGGSFNPVHNGHIEIAKKTFEIFKLSEVVFIPANISPLKDPYLSENKNERLAMLELALKEYPFFSLSTYELDKGGKSITLDTIRYFLKKSPEYKFYFLMGEDSFETIEFWHSYEEIFKIIDLIVYPRKNYLLQKNIRKFSSFKKVSCAYKNTEAYVNKEKHFLYYIKCPQIDNSSTFIRNKIDEIDSCQELMPQKVFEFAKSKNLYKK